jgi:hypothetical protein
MAGQGAGTIVMVSVIIMREQRLAPVRPPC